MNTWYSIKAAAKADGPTEVFLFDEIGGWGVTAAQFVADVKAITGPIVVRINSVGGSVFEALAIFNYLSTRGNVETRVDGLAASSASIVFLAGQKRTMPESAWLMVHNPWTYTAGDYADLREQADLLDRFAASLAGIYAKATGLALDVVRGLMDSETWLDGKEAIAKGFAHETTADAPVMASITPGRFRNAPTSLLSATAVQPDGGAKKPGPTAKPEPEMKNSLLALLGKTASERETFLASAITGLGVTEEAITAAQKDGKADFVAEHIKARISDADAKTAAAIGERDAAAKARDEHKAKADALLAAAGVTEPGDDIAKAFKAAIDARVSREVAEHCAKLGIKPVAAEKPDATKTKDDIVAQFNAMKPGPERSAFFAKHRAVIVGG